MYRSLRAEFEGRVMYSARPAAKLEVTQRTDPRFGQYAAHKSHAPRRKHIKCRFPATAAECGETRCQEMAPIQMKEWRTRVFLEGSENDGDGVAEASVFSTVANFLCPLARWPTFCASAFILLAETLHPAICLDNNSSHLIRALGRATVFYLMLPQKVIQVSLLCGNFQHFIIICHFR
jgi:hypothetical protein